MRADGLPSLGISVSDFVAARGHVDSAVYSTVSHIEYGGFGPAAHDIGVKRILETSPDLSLGRHVVSTEIFNHIDPTHEAKRLRDEVNPLACQYFLTDAEFWQWGGSGLSHLWPRPVALTRKVVREIARNVRQLRERLGIPFLVENPAFLVTPGELRIEEFMRELAAEGVELCLDIGHFYAGVRNAARSVRAAWDLIPHEAIVVAHIAGLSCVIYQGGEFLLDNHDVQPLGDCMDLLEDLVQRAPNLKWVTYEAELATTTVQLHGIQRLERILQRREAHA